ncbi:hypothetical protein ACVD45_03200 [Staphylococcus aureus]
MKKVLAGIVILLLVVALGFSIFFAATGTKQSNSSDDHKTEKHDKKRRKIKRKKNKLMSNLLHLIMEKMHNQNQSQTTL